MSEQSDESPAVAPTATPVLAYAPPPKRVSLILQGTILLVSVTNLGVGILLLIFVWGGWFAGRLESSGALGFGLLLIACGIMLCIRSEQGWRRAFALLVGASVLCAVVAALSIVMLWRHRGEYMMDTWMPRLLFGGLFGVLNSAGGYILCSVKSVYGAGQLNTRRRKRLCLILWPAIFLLLAGGIWVVMISPA